MTIRQIDDDTKAWLRRRAAAHGRSVESEVRALLALEKRRDDPAHYPPGMAPLPGEKLGTWMARINDDAEPLETIRDSAPLRDPYAD
jgi:hypothetical protein